MQSRHRVAGGACIKCCLRGNKIGFQAPHTLAMAKKLYEIISVFDSKILSTLGYSFVSIRFQEIGHTFSVCIIEVMGMAPS